MTKFLTAAPVAATVAIVSLFAMSSASQADTIAKRRPLTVRRAVAPAPAVVAAPVAPAVVAAPIGAASTIVAAPFTILGGIFPAGGARPGGVTDVRYVGAGAKQAEIDEGWTVPVPVDRSGPIYVVANGDPTVSPLTFIGYPIRAIGTVAQTPFRILGF